MLAQIEAIAARHGLQIVTLPYALAMGTCTR